MFIALEAFKVKHSLIADVMKLLNMMTSNPSVLCGLVKLIRFILDGNSFIYCTLNEHVLNITVLSSQKRFDNLSEVLLKIVLTQTEVICHV